MYQGSERVPLHVQSLQELQPLILQQLHGELAEVAVVEEQVLVALLLGHADGFVELSGHGCSPGR